MNQEQKEINNQNPNLGSLVLVELKKHPLIKVTDVYLNESGEGPSHISYKPKRILFWELPIGISNIAGYLSDLIKKQDLDLTLDSCDQQIALKGDSGFLWIIRANYENPIIKSYRKKSRDFRYK